MYADVWRECMLTCACFCDGPTTALARAAQLLDVLDVDGDGKITEEELMKVASVSETAVTV